ncbi:MAG: hypothetical protein Q4G42_03585 [Neisseria sp.]|nr:hypothetical protein [Neisseria sp.]
MNNALFDTVEAALTFAFRYAQQQSPRTPMTHLMQTSGGGRGLYGLDGAAQAGFILSALDRLPREQRYAVTVRFGDVRSDCPCCGQLRPTHEWQDARDGLCGFVELEGLPHEVRHGMIEQILCNRRADITALCKRYCLIRSTAYRQLALLKERLRKLETLALNALSDDLRAGGAVKRP